MTARLWAGGVLGALTAALLTVPATAAADPVVEQAGDTIEYSDPDLVGESTEDVKGTLRIAAIDRRSSTDYVYAIETADGETIPVDVAGDLPADAANGVIVAEVVDPESDAQLAEASIEPAPEKRAAAGAGRPHSVYMVRVSSSSGMALAPTIAQRLKTQVLDEWKAESGGAITDFTVKGSAELTSRTCGLAGDDVDRLWDQGQAKFATVDFGLGTGNHLMMVVNEANCGASDALGVGTFGSSINDGGATTVLYDEDFADGTGVHELGHNFGLGHANVKSCATCAENEYLDIFSVMGFGVEGSEPQALDSLFRDRLGIVQDGEIDDLSLDAGQGQVSRSVTLAERGATDGRRGLRVQEPDSGKVYWLEYRGGGGRDTGSSYASGSGYTTGGYAFAPGVTVTQDSTNLDYVEDIELLPNGRSGSFGAGSTFTSASGETSLRVGTVGNGSAAVTVSVRRSAPRILTTGLGGAALVDREAFTRLGTWPSGTQHTYDWQIDGATVSTGDTYTPTGDQVGRPLVLSVTSTAPGQAAYTRSTAAQVIAPGRWTSTLGAKISGTVKTGRTVTAAQQTWKPGASQVTTWYIGGKAFSSKPVLKLSTAWKGRALTLKTVGTRPGYPTVAIWTRAGAIR